MINYEKQLLQLAKKHAKIIEDNLREVMEVYGCLHTQLALQIKQNTQYSVLIKAKEFEIVHEFTWGDGYNTTQV